MNLQNLNEDILKNLSIWLGVSLKRIKSLGEILPQKPNEYFEGILDREIITPLEGLIRRLTHKLIKSLPNTKKYYVLDNIKKIRQLKRKNLIEISNCRFVKLERELRQKLNLEPISWEGRKAVICLSCDIDSKEDYGYIKKVYALHRKYQLPLTFNFLTQGGYEIDHNFLNDFIAGGNEVGLHGLTHDIAIGIRPRKRIKEELSLALKELGLPVQGYRAPAFAISKKLLKIIKALGLKYDSSMKSISCYGQAVETFYPYRYPDVGIWEIPLTIQDDRIFRDLHLSCEEGLGVIKELTKRIIDVAGVVVINNHPRLIKQRLYYYTELLKWISSLPNVWVTTPSQLIDFMEKREESVNQESNEITFRQTQDGKIQKNSPVKQ